jgi:hypothetical protein
MTSITSVSSAATASLQLKTPAQTAVDSGPATSSSVPTVGSSSAAAVPSAIAALSLRGSDSDGDNDGH